MQPDKIDIGWCARDNVHSNFAASIAGQAADMQYFEALGNIHATTGVSLLARGRNLNVVEFLKGDSDWLWAVDTDMMFDKGHWLKLYNMAEETGADMVTGLTFIFHNGRLIPSLFYENTMDGALVKDGNNLPDNGAEVAASGMASVLIHRRVFEGMEPARHPDYRWFDQTLTEQGRMSGEDTHFFTRAREAGYTLRVCTEAETWHMKSVGLGKGDFLKQRELREQGIA